MWDSSGTGHQGGGDPRAGQLSRLSGRKPQLTSPTAGPCRWHCWAPVICSTERWSWPFLLCRKCIETSSTGLTEKYSLHLVTPSEDYLQPSKGQEPRKTPALPHGTSQLPLTRSDKAEPFCVMPQGPAARVTGWHYRQPCWRASRRRGVRSQGPSRSGTGGDAAHSPLADAGMPGRDVGMPWRDAGEGCREKGRGGPADAPRGGGGRGAGPPPPGGRSRRRHRPVPVPPVGGAARGGRRSRASAAA